MSVRCWAVRSRARAINYSNDKKTETACLHQPPNHRFKHYQSLNQVLNQPLNQQLNQARNQSLRQPLNQKLNQQLNQALNAPLNEALSAQKIRCQRNVRGAPRAGLTGGCFAMVSF